MGIVKKSMVPKGCGGEREAMICTKDVYNKKIFCKMPSRWMRDIPHLSNAIEFTTLGINVNVNCGYDV